MNTYINKKTWKKIRQFVRLAKIILDVLNFLKDLFL